MPILRTNKLRLGGDLTLERMEERRCEHTTGRLSLSEKKEPAREEMELSKGGCEVSQFDQIRTEGQEAPALRVRNHAKSL